MFQKILCKNRKKLSRKNFRPQMTRKQTKTTTCRQWQSDKWWVWMGWPAVGTKSPKKRQFWLQVWTDHQFSYSQKATDNKKRIFALGCKKCQICRLFMLVTGIDYYDLCYKLCSGILHSVFWEKAVQNWSRHRVSSGFLWGILGACKLQIQLHALPKFGP